MTADVHANFIRPVAAIFPPADEVAAEELFAAVAAALGHFDEAALRRGAARILKTRKRLKFPLPSECAEACVEAGTATGSTGNPPFVPKDPMETRQHSLTGERLTARRSWWGRSNNAGSTDAIIDAYRGRAAGLTPASKRISGETAE